MFLSPAQRGRFDENGENHEFRFYPLKTRLHSSDPRKRRKLLKWQVTQAKTWFRKSRACPSRTKQRHQQNLERSLEEIHKSIETRFSQSWDLCQNCGLRLFIVIATIKRSFLKGSVPRVRISPLSFPCVDNIGPCALR